MNSQKMYPGKLYLIPSTLADDTSSKVITPQVKEVIQNTKHFLVENPRTARRYISSLRLGLVIEDLHLEVLDKNTLISEIPELLKPLWDGHDLGIISEAGCPGIADPGSMAVEFAHEKGIQVVPLSGPSSFFLALMGSGFNGQSFAFHGYLPLDKKERARTIKSIEFESSQQNRTQIFMETPFRNNALFEELKNSLNSNTKLCIAKNLTAADEYIQTKTILEWRKVKMDLHKIPVVFVLFAE
jgi:16S rRNA (cytidine1402-2'-O)-methyltransferase